MQEIDHEPLGWYNEIIITENGEHFLMEFELYHIFPGDLHHEWNKLLAETSVHVPFLRYEYLETWWQTRGGGEWSQDSVLVLVTARESGHLVGIAPLFLAAFDGHNRCSW